MIKINLVPAEILAKAAEKQQKVQAAIIGSILAILVAGVSAMHLMKAQRLEKKLADDRAELAKLAAIVEKVKQLEAQAAAVRQRLKVISDLLKSRPLYPIFMSEFVRSVPIGVWVKSMAATHVANGLRLTIDAEAQKSEDIMDWIRALESTGKFAGVEITGAVTVSGAAGAAEKAYNFKLSGVYTPKF